VTARVRRPAASRSNAAPRATYRLQLRNGVDLREAARLAPYLARLGASHLYLSPVFAARRDSAHGYDVVDPARVDPALGGEPAFAQLSRRLARHGIALLLDIVPNHMAAHPENPYFEDVLTHGRRSTFVSWFDIDWGAAGATARVTLPVLGRGVGECLAHGEITLEPTPQGPRLRYFELSLPVAPGTVSEGASPADFGPDPAGRRRLRRLLAAQHYRLVWWRRTASELNYRRFFDINELIALRADQPSVFDATHAKLFELVRRGWVQGVRVDHIDGLADPAAYLRRLRRGLRRAARSDDALLVVEKILARDERLPPPWPVDGTTGYEFLNAVEAILLDPEGVARVEREWRRITGLRGGFEQVARAAKRGVLERELRPDLRRFVRELTDDLGRRGRVPVRELTVATRELIAQLSVYRVYPELHGMAEPQRARLEDAFARARVRHLAPPRGLGALRRALLPGPRGYPPNRLALARRFQQIAAPAMAKGVEDTALYQYAPLLSRNEVGGEPGAPLDAATAELHTSNRERAQRGGRDLLTVSTHDTKRSADVRARLDVLSESPDEWLAALTRWKSWNRTLHGCAAAGWPDAASELLFYQTLVGVWPMTRRPAVPGGGALRELADRLDTYLCKAVREAKRHTSWRDPNPRFEASLSAFVHRALDPARGRTQTFLKDVARLVHRIQRSGLCNSLARTLVALGSPGIPDLYQGDEVWNFSLVDPDNRRAVDFAALDRYLGSVESGLRGAVGARARFAAHLCAHPEDPRFKLLVIGAGLRARRRDPELFLDGSYESVEVEGTRSEHVFAFSRCWRGRVALVAVTRLPHTLAGAPGVVPIGPRVWSDTRLVLPTALAGRSFRCAITNRQRTLPKRPPACWPLAEVFEEIPAALYVA